MRILDAFFAARPLVLIPAWSFFLLGAATDGVHGVAALRLVLLSLILVATHLLNQVIDFESDRLNHKGFFLQRGVFTQKQYVTIAVGLLIGALAIAWMRRDAAVLLTIAACLGLAYNLQPLRLSHRPCVDLVANAIGYGGIAFLLGRNDTTVAALAAPLIATTGAVGAVFLHTTLLDSDGDRSNGKITTGVWLGNRGTRLLAAALATLAVVVAWSTQQPLLWGPCASLAVLTWFSNSQRISVWGTVAFTVAAAVAFWWFAVGVVLLVMLTRAFYARRFALRYPSF
jgi:4-hydroxybenzoate polyprenyltransferase